MIPKMLSGSTVGYPSDRLAFCINSTAVCGSVWAHSVCTSVILVDYRVQQEKRHRVRRRQLGKYSWQ